MIKKLLITSVICFNFLYLNGQNIDVYGVWESANSSQPFQMILDEEGFMTFKTNGQFMGGKGYEIDGEILRMTYKTRPDKSGIKITITVKDLIRKEILKTDTGTIELSGNDNLKMCFKKPGQFDASVLIDDCRYFMKVK